jgi:hypothetical protein
MNLQLPMQSVSIATDVVSSNLDEGGWPTLCDKVCQWLMTGRWFSPGPPVSSTNKTDCYIVAEILLKVVLNTIKQTRNNMNVSQQGRLSNFTFMHQLNYTEQSLYCCSIFHNYNRVFNNDHNSYHKMTVWNCS